MPNIKAVFFDLDGTLLDTAPDLAAACNIVLAQYHRPAIPLTEFRGWIYGGARMMLCNSFQIEVEHPQFSAIRTAFLQQYQQRLTEKTSLFPGIEEVLSYLEQAQIPWGVITNKIASYTHPLLAHFGLTQRCCCIVSGDTLPIVKPHPAPLWHACELLQVAPQHCIYIGDAPTDITAARAAQMPSIAAAYGYLPKDSNPVEWGADALVNSPSEIVTVLRNWLCNHGEREYRCHCAGACE